MFYLKSKPNIMITTSLIKATVSTNEKSKRGSLLKWYVNYAEKQEEHRFLWYMLSVLFFSCGIMIPTIFLMGIVSDNPVWFISLSVLLFYANIIVHIAEYKSTVFVPVFHLTTAFMVLTPMITLIYKLYC